MLNIDFYKTIRKDFRKTINFKKCRLVIASYDNYVNKV